MLLSLLQSAEDTEKALASGAFQAGDDVLVKRLETGQIYYEEFDQVVSHVDALPLISKLKPILKERFPMKATPRVGDDVQALVEKYVKGYEYETRKVEGISEESYLSVPLGEISWSPETLTDNFMAFLQEINSDASGQITGNRLSRVRWHASSAGFQAIRSSM